VKQEKSAFAVESAKQPNLIVPKLENLTSHGLESRRISKPASGRVGEKVNRRENLLAGLIVTADKSGIQKPSRGLRTICVASEDHFEMLSEMCPALTSAGAHI